MLPRILVVLALTSPVAISAQYMTTAPNGQVAPAGSTVVLVGNGGGPAVSTPNLTFSSPPNTAGISLADRAGISDSAPNINAIPSASESYPVYSNYGYQQGQTVAPEAASAATPTANTTGRLINDVGPSEYGGAAFAGGGVAGPQTAATGTASLGEVAAKYKSSRPQNIHTYTNADAQRLNDSMNVHGVNTAPVSAQNVAPTAPQSQPSAQPAPGTEPQLSAGLRPSPAVRQEPQAGTAPQTSTASQSSGAGQQSATTPEISQQSPGNQGSDQQAGKSLPATSTLLPLFGLLGVASGGLGLLLRKLRK